MRHGSGSGSWISGTYHCISLNISLDLINLHLVLGGPTTAGSIPARRELGARKFNFLDFGKLGSVTWNHVERRVLCEYT